MHKVCLSNFWTPLVLVQYSQPWALAPAQVTSGCVWESSEEAGRLAWFPEGLVHLPGKLLWHWHAACTTTLARFQYPWILISFWGGTDPSQMQKAHCIKFEWFHSTILVKCIQKLLCIQWSLLSGKSVEDCKLWCFNFKNWCTQFCEPNLKNSLEIQHVQRLQF